MSDINGVLQSFSDRSSALKSYCSHPNPAVMQADIVDDIEDRSDQSRLSNTDLDRSEQNTEGLNGTTDISDENNSESICEFTVHDHETTIHGLLTEGMLREFLQPVMVIH